MSALVSMSKQSLFESRIFKKRAEVPSRHIHSRLEAYSKPAQ